MKELTASDEFQYSFTCTPPRITMHGAAKFWSGDKAQGYSIEVGISYGEDMEDGETVTKACTRMRKNYLKQFKDQVKAKFISLGFKSPI